MFDSVRRHRREDYGPSGIHPIAWQRRTSGVLPTKGPEQATQSVYKGLAFAVNTKGAFLFATNFSNGTVDVFGPNGTDGMFTKVTLDDDFTDREIPAGYAPFNIANIDGDLFVTYAKQNAEKHDDVGGAGHGFVDVFDTDGHLIRRFESRGRLNSPWGIARASFAFGPFSGKILIGNFGDGRINVFNNDGTLVDQLEDVHGKPLVVEGLWTLTLGGGRNSWAPHESGAPVYRN